MRRINGYASGYSYSFGLSVQGLYSGNIKTQFWWNVGHFSFSYDAESGCWYYGLPTPTPLSSSGLSAAFIGDGNWHNVGNGWSYDFNYASSGSKAYWRNELLA
jgi:hypothetical protein